MHERKRSSSRAKPRSTSVHAAEAGSLAAYLAEINRHPLLTVEAEQRLARQFRDNGDVNAQHALVVSNLRFVVKVAYEYRSYGLKLADLIQEGNIGLMRAVQKFDPDRQIRLISYAAWWIRAYIQNDILKSWSLVKIGTTQAQRKLFFSLARTIRELERLGADPNDMPAIDRKVAKRLRVKAAEVTDMRMRLDGRDRSLDAPLNGGESDNTHAYVDFLRDGADTPEEQIIEEEGRRLLHARLYAALQRLDKRERLVVERRVMADKPMTLKALGEVMGFSREYVRQIEKRAKEKLRKALEETDG